MLKIILISLTSMILTSFQASASGCQSQLDTTCTLSFNYQGQPVLMETGIFKEQCGLREGGNNTHRCMMARLCSKSTKGKKIEFTGPIIHETPTHLNSLCIKTKNPRTILEVDDQTYIRIKCQKNEVMMVLVAGEKKKTCPLPFKLP